MRASLSVSLRRAWVTGASGGLGQAFAHMLLAEGLEVWGTARSIDRLARLTANPRFHPVELDLESPTALEVYREASRVAGGFDLVVNNAGYGVFAPFESMRLEDWNRQWQAMIPMTFALTHACYTEFRARGRGVLVNVASLATEFPLPFMSGYNAAKAALSALSESLAVEARGTSIVVIDFRPGDYRTDFNLAMKPKTAWSDPSGRIGRAWTILEKNLATAPAPEKAARDLAEALRRGQSGIVRSGSWFQAWLAPKVARLLPEKVRRAIVMRYFGVN